MEGELNWNYQEFLTFILIHASYADLEFTDDERDQIKKNISVETFDKIHEHYLGCGDYQKLQTILDYKGLYYPTATQKNELLDRMTQQFAVDGDYSLLEHNLREFLVKLL